MNQGIYLQCSYSLTKAKKFFCMQSKSSGDTGSHTEGNIFKHAVSVSEDSSDVTKPWTQL